MHARRRRVGGEEGLDFVHRRAQTAPFEIGGEDGGALLLPEEYRQQYQITVNDGGRLEVVAPARAPTADRRCSVDISTGRLPEQRYRSWLEREGLWNPARDQELTDALREEMETAIRKAESAPPPEPETRRPQRRWSMAWPTTTPARIPRVRLVS